MDKDMMRMVLKAASEPLGLGPLKPVQAARPVASVARRPRGRVVKWFGDAMIDGELRVGDELPSERALAASLGVARSTVVLAMRHLEAGGWVGVDAGSNRRRVRRAMPTRNGVKD